MSFLGFMLFWIRLLRRRCFLLLRGIVFVMLFAPTHCQCLIQDALLQREQNTQAPAVTLIPCCSTHRCAIGSFWC